MFTIAITASPDDRGFAMSIDKIDISEQCVLILEAGFAILPFVWEYNENFYRLHMILPSYVMPTMILDQSIDELNGFIDDNLEVLGDCMIDDDQIGRLL